MKTESRTVRVFLSSTFRDFAEERDLLVRKIFPELRRKCRERQVELVDVDLRWGITEKEAQQGKVLPICLAEIDRSRPYFMGFIGERYGWVPKKHEYDESLTLEQTWLEEHRGGKSVTELEMLHGVLNNPAMEDRAFFYFRDPDYSNSKGGAYLSESPEDKAKLEELKDRIRKSGFPVVENYTNPEALAEHVKQDLRKLIDDAFPESKVPNALDLERRRHEIYSASRQGMYIGGEQYFAALDQAMADQPRTPVLVTGASGGGKSALVANWSQSFATGHPSAVVLEHYLATGADSAEATGMVTRLLKEISRLTGEDLVLEGDPRKALHMFAQWLGKAGAFAQQQGGEFVVVLDGLDKMTGGGGLDWWPRRLPDGVGLVVSCLPGSVFDFIAKRMDWDQVVVSPLGRDDCQAFIGRYLGKFRKPLPPELVGLVLQHPLCGNPLFLRTLLEEMRVFGVHEQLKQKLNHYLASSTVDDLFERVLGRIEADNRPDDVRAVLEVLWAAKESFAEDELLEISGLPPAVWAPIHIALDDSLIGEGGRLLFGHDYMRKAVEDRYLHSAKARGSIRKRMAEFCQQAMAGSRKDISPYVRRHAVKHFLDVEDWDSATAALSDLEFIEARSTARELPAMLIDYAEAAKMLPEGQMERETDAARQADLDRYAKEMAEYAVAWSRIRDGSGAAEPCMPRPLECVRLWTSEEIATERKRMTETPSRLDTVKGFRVFVASNSSQIQRHCKLEGFIANLARNDAPTGPVHDAGKRQLKALNCLKLLKRFRSEELYNSLPACRAVLAGHTGPVLSLVLSADGRRIISCSSDKTLRVWDAETGECLKVLEGHTELIQAIALSADGRRVVSGSYDATLRIWEVETGECLKVLEGHTGWVQSLVMSADGRRVVSGSHDDTLRVWDAETGECLKVLEGHTELIQAIALSADGRRVVSGSYDATLRIWEVETGGCLKVLEGHTGTVAALVLSADGRSVVSCSSDKTLRVWDAETGECLKVLEGHTGTVAALVLSADGQRIVSGSDDKTLRIWKVATGECLKVLEGHAGWAKSLVLSADGRRIVSGSDDKTLRIWEVETGECLKVLEGHTGWVQSLVVSADGRCVVSGSFDDTLRVWDVETGECLKMLERHTGVAKSLVLSADGRRIVSGSDDKTLRIWEVETGECLKVLEGHTEVIQAIALSADGRRIVSGSYDDTLRVWDVETGECLKVLEGHTKMVVSLVLSASRRRVVSGSYDDTLRIWDMETGESLKVLEGHTGSVAALVLSADGRRFVSGSFDNTLRVWDMETGECLKVLEGHTGSVAALVLSADGRRFVSGSFDNTLRIWDMETGECLKVLEGHTELIQAIALSADGRRIVSGSHDNTLRLWDMETGKCLKVLEGHTGPVAALVLSADGRWVVSGSFDNTVRAWNNETGAQAGLFCLRGLVSISLNSNTLRLGIGSSDGRVELYEIQNLSFGPLITTAHREIISQDLPAGPVTSRPPCCGQLIPIPDPISERIEYWNHEGGDGGYTDLALLLDCPYCGTRLRLNPFFVNLN